jgi:hypothetical protein
MFAIPAIIATDSLIEMVVVILTTVVIAIRSLTEALCIPSGDIDVVLDFVT